MTAASEQPLRRWLVFAGIALLALGAGASVCLGNLYFGAAAAVSGGIVLISWHQALGLRSLTWWLVAGVVLYPFARYPQQHALFTFDRAWILSMAVAVLVSQRNVCRPSTQTRAVMGALWLLVATALIRAMTTTGGSGVRQGAIESVLDTIILPGLLFFVARRLVNDRSDWERLLKAFVVAGVLLGLFAVGERFLGFELATRSGGSVQLAYETGIGVRVSGPYATDDALAVALLVCLAATLLWIQADLRPRWRLGLLVLALELGGITFTFFRGAWIATLVVFVVCLGLRPRRYARVIGMIALCAAVAVAVIAGAGDSGALSQRLNNTQNVNGRFATYGQAFQLFERHVAVGVGIGQFATVQETDLPTAAFAGVTAAPSAHDSYLDLLAEGGLFVAIPFVMLNLMVGRLVHRLRKLGSADPFDVLIGAAVLAAALAYVLISLEETVITSSTASNAFLAVLLGAAASRLDHLTSDRRSRAADRRPTFAASAAPPLPAPSSP
jgi:O-Antigen ligase